MHSKETDGRRGLVPLLRDTEGSPRTSVERRYLRSPDWGRAISLVTNLGTQVFHIYWGKRLGVHCSHSMD